MTDTAPVIRPAEIAAYLAARMCHDFISPASAIASGLDLLEDPSAQDMREEAMGLIVTSSKKLADLLSYCRVAFGASASAETFDARDLEKLAQGVFAHMRADLEWTVDTPAISKHSPKGFGWATDLHAQNFLECIRTRKTPTAPMRLAFQAALVVQLVNLSLKHGRRYKWNAASMKVEV